MNIYKFVVSFYILYLLLALIGSIFINFRELGLLTYLYYFIYVLSLLSGIFIGKNCNIQIKPLFSIDIEKLLNFFLLLSLVAVAISWFFMINYYSSLEYIILNSFTIREETIGAGESPVPVSVSYLTSFQYFTFILSLVVFSLSKRKKYIAYSIILFISIVITDLRTFGRIGILFSIFAIISWMILYKIKIFSFKKLGLIIVLYFLLMLPRLIRGSFDNFSSTVSNYGNSFLVDIPSFLYGPLTIYIYYFGSLYAFDKIIDLDIIYSYGMRNFAPLINISNNIFHFRDERMHIITDSVNIPFQHNIFSIVGELWFDFGYIGVIIFPIIFGFIIGYVFNLKNVLSSILKIFMLIWIFYSPIYNVFSFGNFIISLIIAFFITTFFYVKNERN